MAELNPPSAQLLPPVPALRAKLAIALREVELLRRLIRAAESVRPLEITTANTLEMQKQAKGADGD
jgi:hypothetical protein